MNSLLGVDVRGDGLGELRYRTALGSLTGVSYDEWYARVWESAVIPVTVSGGITEVDTHDG